MSEREQGESGCEIVVTRSGALAIRDRAVGELMHPIVGPIVEAEHLYARPARIEERLLRPEADPVVVLDVGLGAGSNAIAAWKVSRRMGAPARRLEIVSFERSLVALELATRDANAAAFGFDGEALDAARSILTKGSHETPRTRWRLVLGELPATLAPLPAASADVVFWDPFSRRSNPALWTMETFVTLHRACRAGATLHTYSAATSSRAALLLGGFAVGAGEPSSEGKQTTMAAMSVADLARPLDRRWLERLGRSSVPFPVDAPPDALARIAALPQFAP